MAGRPATWVAFVWKANLSKKTIQLGIIAFEYRYKIMHIPSDQYDSFDFSNIADLVNLDKPTIEEFVHKYHNTIL